MKKRPLYQKAIAFLLLATYLFISTPVNLWHHHDTAIANQITEDGLQHADVSLKTNCLICSHHYSAYNEVNIVALPVLQEEALVLPICHHIEKEDQDWNRIYANKGPPLV